MSLKLKEIKRILKEHDVRDPRGALLAIEQVISRKSVTKQVLKLEAIDHGDRAALHIKSLKNIEPKHVRLAIDGLRELADRKAAQCEAGECATCTDRPPVKELLANLFAQFEAEQLKRGGK